MSSTLARPARTARTAEERGQLGRLALLASIVISFLAASAAPTPLYQHYAQLWHGTALTTTEAFGVYAVAVLVGLLLFGEISNHVGRRPVLLGALALQIVAVALFATAGSFEPLFAGRIVQGVAAGAALGTLGAAMIEAHRVHGTVASSAAPGLGTGIGALSAGLVVGYLPWPTHLIYLVLLAVFAVQIVGVVLVLEATPTERGLARSLRPTLAVPARVRREFVAAAPVLFSVWALAGLYGSLGPALVRDLSGSTEVALGGITLFLLAGVASITTVVRRDHDARAQLVGGTVALLVGVLGSVAAIEVRSLWGFLAATLVSGIGFGSGFQGGLRSIIPLATPQERPGLLSAAYLVSYAGLGLPAVVAGFLVSRGLSLTGVAVGYAVVLAVLATASLALLRRRAS